MSVRRVQYEFPGQWRPYDLNVPEDLKSLQIIWDRSVQ